MSRHKYARPTLPGRALLVQRAVMAGARRAIVAAGIAASERRSPPAGAAALDGERTLRLGWGRIVVNAVLGTRLVLRARQERDL